MLRQVGPKRILPFIIRFFVIYIGLSGFALPPNLNPPGLECLTQAEYQNLHPVFRWRNSYEHFWTTDLQGEQAAKRGYFSEGRVFYVSSQQSAQFSLSIFRLLGPKGHIYTTDSSERQQLLRNGFADEGILGYISPSVVQGCSMRAVRSFHRATDGLRFLTINPAEATALENQGYRFEKVVGYVTETGPRPANNPYTVGVYYFGMWSHAAFETIEGWPFGNRNFYGTSRSEDWWLGVRDMYENNCNGARATPPPEFTQFCWLDWSYLKPAIGYYDVSKVETLEKHIQQAKENGIAFFNFYWYWNYYLNREDVNDGLESFLRARNSQDLKFAITICQHGGHLSIDDSQFQLVAKTIVAKYIRQPHYLRTRAGQPIINICDTKGIWNIPSGEAAGDPPDKADFTTIKLFLDTLRLETHTATGKWPLLTARVDDARYAPDDPADINYPGLITLVEAGNCILPTGPNSSYYSVATGAYDWLSKHRKWKPLMPCFMQNLDERPRVGVMKNSGPFFHLSDHSLANFTLGLQDVKTWMDAQNDELSHILTIYAWNEWHEGGIVEPNIRDGAIYLNAISDAFELPIGHHPCRITGNCPGIP